MCDLGLRISKTPTRTGVGDSPCGWMGGLVGWQPGWGVGQELWVPMDGFVYDVHYSVSMSSITLYIYMSMQPMHVH